MRHNPVNCYTPYPSTPLYDAAVQEGFKPPETLEEWGHHTIYGRMPRDPEVRRKYQSYLPRKPAVSIQRLKRAARHMEDLIKR